MHWGIFYTDQDSATLFATRGQPAETPWQLALVLVVFQFAEGLSDDQAADAVRSLSAIDWKYALSLELSDPGFDASVLNEFRTRVVAGQPEQQLLDTMLERFRAAGLLKARGRQRTDSTHMLAAVRQVNRLVLVGATVRHVLNTLAVAAPQWLNPGWTQRGWSAMPPAPALKVRSPKACKWPTCAASVNSGWRRPISYTSWSRPPSICVGLPIG